MGGGTGGNTLFPSLAQVGGPSSLPYVAIGGKGNQMQAAIIDASTQSWVVRPFLKVGFMTQIMDSQTGRPTGWVTDTSAGCAPAGQGRVIGAPDVGNGSANLG